MNKYQVAVEEIEQTLEDLQDFMSSMDLSDPANKASHTQAENAHKVWSGELKRYKLLAKG